VRILWQPPVRCCFDTATCTRTKISRHICYKISRHICYSCVRPYATCA
jgi:hypothetical protein